MCVFRRFLDCDNTVPEVQLEFPVLCGLCPVSLRRADSIEHDSDREIQNPVPSLKSKKTHDLQVYRLVLPWFGFEGTEDRDS